MIRKWKDKKEEKKIEKAEKKAEKKAEAQRRKDAKGNGVVLLGTAPLGTHHYAGETPDYLRKKTKSQSMEVLSEIAHVPPPQNGTRMDKKSRLRAVSSLAGDEDRQRDRAAHDARAHRRTSQNMSFYSGNGTSGQVSVHPNLKVSSSRTPSKQPPSYLPQTSIPPRYPQQGGRSYQAVASSPTSLPPFLRTPSPGGQRHAHYRNIQIIPQMAPRQRAASNNSTASSNTNINTTSPRTSPGSHSPTQRRKGAPIKIVEGWNEPEDTADNVVQSHEVGVAPRSKVMEAFHNRNAASPFAITISSNKAATDPPPPTSSSPSSHRERGGVSRRNKAKQVTVLPFSIITEEDSSQTQRMSIERTNGDLSVTFQ